MTLNMSGQTPASEALTKYLAILQDYAANNSMGCNVGIVSQQVCNLNSIELSNCSNIALTCCNETRYNVQTLDCSDTDTVTQAAVSAVLEQTQKSPDADAYVVSKLKEYMGSAYNPALSLAANIAEFIAKSSTCKNFIGNNQNITLNIKGTDCNNGSFYLLNQSNNSVRCAAKGLSNLLPDDVPAPPSPAPATRPWYYVSKTTMYVLISLGVVFLILAITLAVLRRRASTAPLPSQ
jgi:hypothetical protein